MSFGIIKLINGGIAVDDRGSVRFVNDFNLENVKRFYQVENFSLSTIRGFHGHKKEGKYVYATKGTALVCAIKIDDFKNPSKKLKVKRFVLSDKSPKILFIPAGFANGFKSLENDTSLIFFSTSTLKQSEKDDYRFPYNYWGENIWKIKNR
jgi:dTDP-4-dehydrorhamnose 3,5-epimerase